MLNKRSVKRNTVAKRQGSSKSVGRVKTIIFVALPALLIAAAGYLAVSSVRSAFTIERIDFTGNAHLSDEDLKTLAGLKSGENIFTLSGEKIFRKISASPWIRYVAVRKELPDRLHILVREAEPLALLDMKGRLFLVDEQGKMLEQIKESSMPFLPIISGDPYGEKDAYSEAVYLVRTIKETRLLARKNHIEVIAHKPEEIALNLDGVVVKIGAGEYADKLSRLVELEDEIKGRHIPVDYIDLRFANRVVVKPVNEVIR